MSVNLGDFLKIPRQKFFRYSVQTVVVVSTSTQYKLIRLIDASTPGGPEFEEPIENVNLVGQVNAEMIDHEADPTETLPEKTG